MDVYRNILNNDSVQRKQMHDNPQHTSGNMNL